MCPRIGGRRDRASSRRAPPVSVSLSTCVRSRFWLVPRFEPFSSSETISGRSQALPHSPPERHRPAIRLTHAGPFNHRSTALASVPSRNGVLRTVLRRGEAARLPDRPLRLGLPRENRVPGELCLTSEKRTFSGVRCWFLNCSDVSGCQLSPVPFPQRPLRGRLKAITPPPQSGANGKTHARSRTTT